MFHNHVSSVHIFKSLPLSIGYGDLFSVKKEIVSLAAKWRHIGLALGLDPAQLDTIDANNRYVEDCLTEVLSHWLKQAYDTEQFGQPSWRLLAKAVGDPAGGNNPALAERIAQSYGGAHNNS